MKSRSRNRIHNTASLWDTLRRVREWGDSLPDELSHDLDLVLFGDPPNAATGAYGEPILDPGTCECQSPHGRAHEVKHNWRLPVCVTTPGNAWRAGKVCTWTSFGLAS